MELCSYLQHEKKQQEWPLYLVPRQLSNSDTFLEELNSLTLELSITTTVEK